MATIHTNKTEVKTENFPFHVKDAKGRLVGCNVRTWEVDSIYTGGDCGNPTGHLFTVQIRVSRNGESYGASSCLEFFKTEEERAAFITSRVEACRKANVKKYA